VQPVGCWEVGEERLAQLPGKIRAATKPMFQGQKLQRHVIANHVL
jgi:hypothetical protein